MSACRGEKSFVLCKTAQNDQSLNFISTQFLFVDATDAEQLTLSSPAPPPAPAETAQVSGVGCSVGLCHRCSLLATNSKLIKLKAQKVTWVRPNQKQHNLEVDSLRCRFTLSLWSKVRKKLRLLVYDGQPRRTRDIKFTSASSGPARTAGMPGVATFQPQLCSGWHKD